MATLFIGEKLATDLHGSAQIGRVSLAGLRSGICRFLFVSHECTPIDTNVSGFEFVFICGSTSDLESKILA